MKGIDLQIKCMKKLGITEKTIEKFVNSYTGNDLVKDLVILEEKFTKKEVINKQVKDCAYWNIDNQECGIDMGECTCTSFLDFDFMEGK